MKRLTSKAMRDYHTFNGLRSITFIEGPLYKTVSLLFPADVELLETNKDSLFVQHKSSLKVKLVYFGQLLCVDKQGNLSTIAVEEINKYS